MLEMSEGEIFLPKLPRLSNYYLWKYHRSSLFHHRFNADGFFFHSFVRSTGARRRRLKREPLKQISMADETIGCFERIFERHVNSFTIYSTNEWQIASSSIHSSFSSLSSWAACRRHIDLQK